MPVEHRDACEAWSRELRASTIVSGTGAGLVELVASVGEALGASAK